MALLMSERSAGTLARLEPVVCHSARPRAGVPGRQRYRNLALPQHFRAGDAERSQAEADSLG